MKIDLEGVDDLVVKQLSEVNYRPSFVSFEEHGVEAIDVLHTIGYRGFKVVDQSQNFLISNPRPPREGIASTFQHSGRSSGLFGKELPGDWIPFDRFREIYTTQIRDQAGIWKHSNANAWFDIHATYLDLDAL